MRNYDPSETADHLSWKELTVIWVLVFAVSLLLASSAFPAPAPFTCEQVQAFVHGKTEAQLQAVLAGMSQHERTAAAQCLKKPAKPHSVPKAQPAPVVVPIALPAPVVVSPPVGKWEPAPAPEPVKPKKKGSLMKLLEIILVAGGGVIAYLVMKFGVVAAVQKVISWWAARKLLPTPQMIMDAFTDIEGRVVDLEKKFAEPAAAPEAKTITINEEAHGDAPEPAKVTPA